MENMQMTVIADTGDKQTKSGENYRVQLFSMQFSNPFNPYSVHQVFFTKQIDDHGVKTSDSLMLSEAGARKKFSNIERDYKFKEAK